MTTTQVKEEALNFFESDEYQENKPVTINISDTSGKDEKKRIITAFSIFLSGFFTTVVLQSTFSSFNNMVIPCALLSASTFAFGFNFISSKIQKKKITENTKLSLIFQTQQEIKNRASQIEYHNAIANARLFLNNCVKSYIEAERLLYSSEKILNSESVILLNNQAILDDISIFIDTIFNQNLNLSALTEKSTNELLLLREISLAIIGNNYSHKELFGENMRKIIGVAQLQKLKKIN